MNRPIIIVFLMVLFISLPCLEYKYKKFYQEVTEEITIDATVVSNKTEHKYFNAYIIKGENSIFNNKKFILYTKNNMTYGDKIRIEGDFIAPEVERNYKGFNYKKYLQNQGIYGIIKEKKFSIVADNNINIILKFTNLLRNAIIKNVEKILPEETRGLFMGILFGDKTNIEKDIIINFQKSSLAHILAVSGTHVSYIVLFITMLFSIGKLPKKWGHFLTIIVLIVFMFLTNFTLSVIRACIMTIIIIISKIVHRKADVINTIVIALLITIIQNPYSIRSVSLQLSYFGTIGVIYLLPIVKKIISKKIANEKILKILSIPISAQLAILPIMIFNFHTFSVTFLISNIIAMPLLGIIIITGWIAIFCSCISISFAQKISIVLNLSIKLLVSISKLFSSFRYSSIIILTPKISTVVIYYIILISIIYIFNFKKIKCPKPFQVQIITLVHIKKRIKTILAIIIMVIVLLEFPYLNFNGELKIFFIDVGQR